MKTLLSLLLCLLFSLAGCATHHAPNSYIGANRPYSQLTKAGCAAHFIGTLGHKAQECRANGKRGGWR